MSVQLGRNSFQRLLKRAIKKHRVGNTVPNDIKMMLREELKELLVHDWQSHAPQKGEYFISI